MNTYSTVIGVVYFNEKILLLKRTPDRTSSPNKWQPVSGFIGEKEPAEEAVLREVKEETNLDGEIIKAGRVFEVTDDYARWIIIPFLISVNSNKVRVDPKEHSEHRWTKPEKISEFDCVKGVKEDLKAVGLL